MVELTPEQRQAAQVRGRRFVAATDEQVATLSMQRRVFWMEGRAFLVVRSDGFLETVATLTAALREPAPAGSEALAAAPSEPPPPPPAQEDALAAEPPPVGESSPASQPAPPSAVNGPPNPGALAITARLVASYVATNQVAIGDLDGLIRDVHRTVTALRQSGGR